MSSKNENTLLKLSKYLYYAFRERSNQQMQLLEFLYLIMVPEKGKQRFNARCWKIKLNNDLRGNVTATANMECFPVSQVVLVRADGTDFRNTVGYFNTTTGIRDPKIFDVPQICHNVTINVEPWKQIY